MDMELPVAPMQAKPLVYPSDLPKTPQSIEAEQAVLGGLMLANEMWDTVSEMIQEKDFIDQKHRFLFRGMGQLARQNHPIDVVTLSEALQQMQILEDAGGAGYVIDLARNTPSAANIKAYASIVRKQSVLRHLITVAHEIADSAYHPQGREVADLLDQAERRVFEISNQDFRGQGPLAIRDVLVRTVERIDELCRSGNQLTGLSTGYYDFDEMTSGLQRSDLIIVAGRPSMGKTTFAMNVVETVAMMHPTQPVLVFSMEMPADSLAMRMISSLGRLDQSKVRGGKLLEEDWPRFTSGVAQLSETTILIDDTPALSPTEVRSRARRVAKEHGALALIVLDYLQLMSLKGEAENRTHEISEISRALKSLAKELNVPVIALSQLNRELEKRPNKRPVMSDLRESGAIEQDADLIAFVYRDEVYNEDSPDKGTAEIIISKQRNGPIGAIRLRFYGQYCRFDNLAPEYYQD
jgi:replicative DNA helicase